MQVISLKHILLLVCTFHFSSAGWSLGSEDEYEDPAQAIASMPFKLGIELQESGNRCPWAASNRAIQKKSLFFVKDLQSDRQLWKVVIDGKDIEFVLEPFSDSEEDLLNKAVRSVSTACKPLMPKKFTKYHLTQALNDPNVIKMIGTAAFELKIGVTLRTSENPELETSFDIWKTWLRKNKKYEDLSEEDSVALWHSDSYQPIKLDSLFRLAKITLKTPLLFRGWLNEIIDPLHKQAFTVQEHADFFPLVQDQTINILEEKIRFQPQATIQYPLEYSIPLFFSLFGFNKESPIITKLVPALPFLEEISQIAEDKGMEKYCTKKTSLVFLHALTLSSIISNNNTDSTLLHNIYRRFEDGQVDAKGLLHFMSRRPFSEMWKNVKDQEDSFLVLYEDRMKKNRVFSQRFFNLSESGEEIEWIRESYPNYAEEFFSEDRPTDLSYLVGLLNPNFVDENRDVLNSLLKKGILSTIMIRNFHPEKVGVRTLDGSEKTTQKIFDAYPQQSVQSIQDTKARYTLDLEDRWINEQVFQYDNLSPPWFLSDDDAMGFYKQSDMQEIQKYGEAIVEIRMIKNACFEPGLFLTRGGKKLLSDTNKLFSFLKEIHKEKILSKESARGILDCIKP